MKISLIFPPCASSTYVPIGIATLKAYLTIHAPHTETKLVDLNISIWNQFSDKNPVFREATRFFKGQTGEFYDEPQFVANNEFFMHMERQILDLVSDVEQALKTGSTTERLDKILGVFIEMVLHNDPDVIGFSILYQMQLPFALLLARSLKALKPELLIILGGAALSIFNENEILNACPEIDAVYFGEGEEGLRLLLMGNHFSSIPGFIFRYGENIQRNLNPKTISSALLPSPDYSDLSLSQYFNPTPVLPVIFSRGCRWNRCRFCSHNFSYAGYRKKRYEFFAEELIQAKNKYGASHFYMADQYINAADLTHLGQAIVDQGCSIHFHVMARPSIKYTPNVFEKLYAAGCRWISWGVESGSQRLLDLCQKGTDVKTIEKNLREASKAGLSNLAMMIFGLPTSTDEDLMQTCQFMEHVQDYVDCYTNSRFQLFSGTPFADDPNQYGLSLTGNEAYIEMNGKIIHSHRLFFSRTNETGNQRSPRSEYEVDFWKRRKLWIKETTFLENMTTEHYLLHVSNRNKETNTPGFTPSPKLVKLPGKKAC